MLLMAPSFGFVGENSEIQTFGKGEAKALKPLQQRLISKGKRIGRRVGFISGALGIVGGVIAAVVKGAAAGSVVPGVGTIVGAVVGGVVGLALATGLGGWIGKKFAERKASHMSTASVLRQYKPGTETFAKLAETKGIDPASLPDGHPRLITTTLHAVVKARIKSGGEVTRDFLEETTGALIDFSKDIKKADVSTQDLWRLQNLVTSAIEIANDHAIRTAKDRATQLAKDGAVQTEGVHSVGLEVKEIKQILSDELNGLHN